MNPLANYRRTLPAPVLGRIANTLVIPSVVVTPHAAAVVNYEVLNVPDPAFGVTAGDVLLRDSLRISGIDYENWGDDDDYLYTLIAVRLGLSLLSPELPPT